MRHRVYGKKLGRNKNQRSGLFKSLVQSLFTYGTIETSEAKAKAIKGMVDKIINLAKDKKIYSLGLTKDSLAKLGNRTSGYTSLVKLGTRLGDQTMMVRMSLIGAGELKPIEKKKEIPKKKVAPKKPVVKKKVLKTK